jgi:hypothetical protein
MLKAYNLKKSTCLLISTFELGKVCRKFIKFGWVLSAWDILKDLFSQKRQV